ncbi:MAG: hypothetical protein BYD32DRAFT_229939 [Podila humilis]|nr:MAG: hypothetical protein BYD32DRAFT_229939 [Podila humilis]
MDGEEGGEGRGRRQTRRMRGVVVAREGWKRSRGGCSLVLFVTPFVGSFGLLRRWTTDNWLRSLCFCFCFCGWTSIHLCLSVCLHTQLHRHIWSRIHYICTSTQPYLLKKEKEKKKQGKPSLSPPFNSPLPTNPSLSFSLSSSFPSYCACPGHPSHPSHQLASYSPHPSNTDIHADIHINILPSIHGPAQNTAHGPLKQRKSPLPISNTHTHSHTHSHTHTYTYTHTQIHNSHKQTHHFAL